MASRIPEALTTATCRCGIAKPRRSSLCWKCTWGLPDALRQRILESSGEEFEAAYKEACRYLDTRPIRVEDRESRESPEKNPDLDF